MSHTIHTITRSRTEQSNFITFGIIPTKISRSIICCYQDSWIKQTPTDDCIKIHYFFAFAANCNLGADSESQNCNCCLTHVINTISNDQFTLLHAPNNSLRCFEMSYASCNIHYDTYCRPKETTHVHENENTLYCANPNEAEIKHIVLHTMFVVFPYQRQN